MSWFTLSPDHLVAKEFRAKQPGEGSARAIERLAAQREGWAEEDDDGYENDELDEEAAELRSKAEAIRHRGQAEAARKAVAKSGGSVVYLGGIGAVVFPPRRKTLPT
jgi:hypothetical protein